MNTWAALGFMALGGIVVGLFDMRGFALYMKGRRESERTAKGRTETEKTNKRG